MLSERATADALAKGFNYVKTLLGVSSNEEQPTLSLVGAPAFTMSRPSEIMRLTPRLYRARMVFSVESQPERNPPLLPRNLGSLSTVEHEVEIRFFLGSSFRSASIFSNKAVDFRSRG